MKTMVIERGFCRALQCGERSFNLAILKTGAEKSAVDSYAF